MRCKRLGLWLALAALTALAAAQGAETLLFSPTPDGRLYMTPVPPDPDSCSEEALRNLPCPGSPCPLECPFSAQQEGEYNPNINDHFNSGCFDTDGTPSFSPIACGDTVCGSSFTRFLIRDTDWYELVVGDTQVDSVRVCFLAEFPAFVAIHAPGANGCADMITVAGADSLEPCESICYTLPPQAGTYWLFIAFTRFECFGCGDYIVSVDCGPGEFIFPPVLGWDMGDLQACYPTETMNPAHGITDVAWLGAAVDSEATPQTLNADEFDDGVIFLAAPWMPCETESVQVAVTAGGNYADYAATGGALYLNAWKDGDLNCSFCDTQCEGAAAEWFLQNVVVTPGTHTFGFTDPGVLSLGTYEGRLRFRLSSLPMTGCPPQALDSLGEVEDYIIGDLQLAVELLGTLNAIAGNGVVSLSWATASERNNDHFELWRDGALITRLSGAGTTAHRRDYRYLDRDLDNGRSYRYQLIAVDGSGVRAEMAVASATPQTAEPVVMTYALYQNYPNPFNHSTSISFALATEEFVTLRLYNLVGAEIATLARGRYDAGEHRVAFEAGALPTGMYLYRIETPNFSATRKLLLLK